jgi:DNA modification methylase/intein/homing endonuclease
MKPIEEWLNRIHCGNAYELLRQMPSESVDCVVTSPPYYGLRDYGSGADTVFGGDPNCEHEWSEGRMTLVHENRNFLVGTQEEVHGKRGTTYIRKFDDRKSGFCVKCRAWRGQLGLEPDWRMYVEHLVELFREVKRVLKKTGSFWLNIGDTYVSKSMNWTEEYANKPQWYPKEPIPRGIGGYRPKCLMGIPWRVAFALIDDGWILRNAVVWHKCLGSDVPIYAKSQGRVLRTTVRELARLPLDDLWLPGIDGGWRKVVRIEKQPESELITLHLRNGTKIEVTPEHIFVLSDGRLVEARNLKKGDCLMHSNLPSEVGTPLGTYENGWVVGLFLAEGNFLKDREAVMFSLNSTESDFSERLRKFAFRYAGSCREYNRGNCKTVLVSGEVPVAIIKHYVSGEQARNKHLSRDAFNESNEFLRGVLDGWLSGDGWYDGKNRRWRIRFTANRELEYDMKAVCSRLGLHMRSRWRRAKGFGKEYPCIDAEIRETTRGHFNQKDDYEIVRIEKTKGISYDIEVDGDHLFLLYDGTVTHNSNHAPESVKDRLTRTYEYVFHFVKSEKYYYNLDNIREPYTDPPHTKGHYPSGKNPGDLWSINTRPFKEAHFATFPPEIPLRPILASCPPDGVVLDPLAGSGTVAYVCELINRGKWGEFRIHINENVKRMKWNLKWIMIEINPEYCKIMEKRLEPFMKQKSLDCF